MTCRVQASDDAATTAQFLLDTGAERTVVSNRVAEELGIRATSNGRMVSATGLANVELATVPRLDAVGITRRDFQIRLHTFPIGLQIDGLLGLDFLRDTRLTLDFRNSVLTIA